MVHIAHQRRENEPQYVSSLNSGGVFIIPLLCNYLPCQFSFLIISGQSRKGEGDNKSKQAGKESLCVWSMCVKRVKFNNSCKGNVWEIICFLTGPSDSAAVKGHVKMFSCHQFQHWIQPCSHYWIRLQP